MTSQSNAAPNAVPAPEGREALDGRRREGDDPTPRPQRKRGRANLERAHKTVTGMAEAVPGGPRSGSV